jgi:hypothetical protein
MSFTIWTLKRWSIRLYPQLFVVWLMSYLYYLWLFVHSGIQCVLNISIKRRMSYTWQELLALRWHWGSLLTFRGICAAHLFRFLCCVLWFFFFLSSSRALSIQMLSVSLDCPFLISPSVFSSVYIITHLMHACLMISSFYMNRIGGIMVNVLAASAALDRGFESRSVQAKVF